MINHRLALTFFVLGISGCLSAPSQMQQGKAGWSSQLAKTLDESEQEGCKVSLDMLPPALATLSKLHVDPGSSGIFFVTAGDEYLSLDVTYLGRAQKDLLVVSSSTGASRRIEENDLNIAMSVVQSDINAVRDNHAEISLQDHDACEFIVLTTHSRPRIYAAQQSTARNNGVLSHGGFVEFRKFLKLLLDEKAKDIYK